MNKAAKVQAQPSFARKCWETLIESYQVSRPSLCFVASTLYLYKNETANLPMALFCTFILQLSAYAGNDYMDWERDHADENRDIDSSRGRASSKNMCWYFYMFANLVALCIGYYDRLFGSIYLVVQEFGGQFLYHGVFCGVYIHEVSLVKRVGFPFDWIVAAFVYMPAPHLLGQHRWIPTRGVIAWGGTLIWAQLKDYEHEKDSEVKTTATVLGPFATKLIAVACALVMMYEDIRLSLYGVYVLYACYLWPGKKYGKMSGVMALNMFLVTVFDKKVDFEVKLYTYGIQAVLAFFYYVYPEIKVRKIAQEKKKL